MELVLAWGLSGTCTVLKALLSICGTAARYLSWPPEANLDRSPCQLIFSTSQVPNLGPQSIVRRSPVCCSPCTYKLLSSGASSDCVSLWLEFVYSWIFIFQESTSSFSRLAWLAWLSGPDSPSPVRMAMSSAAEITSASLAFSFLFLDPSLSKSGSQWLYSLLLPFS